MWKQILSIFIAFLILIGHGDYCYAAELKENDLFSKSAVLMDGESMRILYSKNSEEIMPMASTTKIMTCILALERSNPMEYVSVSSYAESMPDVQLHMVEGESYQMKDLLYAMMLESFNDTAVAIAEHISGSVEEFAELMNKKAMEIGCKNTFFITPNGLDATKTIEDEQGNVSTKEHSTTAGDLAKIMAYCILKSPCKKEFLKITQTKQYSFQNYVINEAGEQSVGGRSFSCINHNAFLSMMPGVMSGKTGFTGKAGYCYVGALESKERTYIVALLACGWPNNKNYKWSDSKKLFQYGCDQFEFKTVKFDQIDLKPQKVANAAWTKTNNKREQRVRFRVKFPKLRYLLKEENSIRIIKVMNKNLKAPIKKGEKMGTIQVYIDEDKVNERVIYAENSIPLLDFSWCIHYLFEEFFTILL